MLPLNQINGVGGDNEEIRKRLKSDYQEFPDIPSFEELPHPINLYL